MGGKTNKKKGKEYFSEMGKRGLKKRWDNYRAKKLKEKQEKDETKDSI